ncbi:ApeI family dehydratase [Acerihabitans arboris]|uniref:AMP-binding protein n=1 Tax=Acerihabitans arboris TaxID=2691583 RepID=A0A845SR95_9GAMM|nr:AMP-binding protein [Acerihabitans arboris]NDL65627.1 AMP-binding protein [Acerihabitans arboris]
MDNQETDTTRRLAPFAVIAPARWLSLERPDATPIAWRGDCCLDLGQLRHDVSVLWHALAEADGGRWALCFDDGYRFLVALLALWLRGKTPVIPGHNRQTLLEEQQALFDGVISDLPLTPDCPLIDPRQYHQPASLPLPPLADDARLILFTSGSTGRPKEVIKTLRAMETESRWLAALLHDGAGQETLAGCRVVSSVTHQHLYGLTFGIFLPISLGLPFALETTSYPEQFIRQCNRHPVLFISSPAFLTRIDRRLPSPRCIGIFSAGGPLPWSDARAAGQWLSAAITDIYGATETGVLAWRRRLRETDLWQPFGGVEFHTAQGRLRVTSALIAEPEGHLLDDRLVFGEDGREFSLAGRDDRVINIEEKRVSLTEVELRLKALPDVDEAVALPLTKHGRHCLGAVIVLSAAGRARLAAGSLPVLARQYRRRLGAWLEPVAVPRHWRVVGGMPRTARGKYDGDRLKELFFTMLPTEISRRTLAGSQAELLLQLDPALFWFRGHFPAQPILPGVAQVDWALHYFRELLALEPQAPDARFSGIESVKFQRPVKPGQTLRLHLEWQAPRRLLTFRYTLCNLNLTDEPTVSSGKIKLCH